jgi:hypothetical protein
MDDGPTQPGNPDGGVTVIIPNNQQKEDVMHLKNPVGRICLMVVVAGLMMAWTGCATAPPANVKTVACEVARVDWDVAPEAELSELACSMGKQGMDPALIFTAALKNVSDRPLRFRMNIFLLDMDKANGHLVPRKGKPPVVAPGATENVKIPFIKTTTMPKKMLVRVVPMGE